jgi:hypothetical protein
LFFPRGKAERQAFKINPEEYVAEEYEKSVRPPNRCPHCRGMTTFPGLLPAVTLRARLRPLAPGLSPRAVLDKFAAIQMLDVHFPTTDGRTLTATPIQNPIKKS